MRDLDNFKKWRHKQYKQISILFKRDAEADVIEKLDSVKSKTQYIVKLVRDDIKKSVK